MTVAQQQEQFDCRNLARAREILRSPDAHGGRDSGVVQWAQRVVDRLAPKTKETK
jgi:hypothetical protein